MDDGAGHLGERRRQATEQTTEVHRAKRMMGLDIENFLLMISYWTAPLQQGIGRVMPSNIRPSVPGESYERTIYEQ